VPFAEISSLRIENYEHFHLHEEVQEGIECELEVNLWVRSVEVWAAGGRSDRVKGTYAQCKGALGQRQAQGSRLGEKESSHSRRMTLRRPQTRLRS
jgi:hypothetical protein